MTTKQAAELYVRAGRAPPPEIAAPALEYIRGTRRKMVGGISFRSTLEADVYQLLKSWRDAGAITNLELQPKFVLQEAFSRQVMTPSGCKFERERAMTYRADFSFDCAGEKWVIESKGFRTESYRMRRKLFLKRYPELKFREWTRGNIGEGVSFNGKVFE